MSVSLVAVLVIGLTVAAFLPLIAFSVRRRPRPRLIVLKDLRHLGKQDGAK